MTAQDTPTASTLDAAQALDPRALVALRDNQRQLDQDGVEVGVSRQALDETLAHLAALQQQLDEARAAAARLHGELEQRTEHWLDEVKARKAAELALSKRDAAWKPIETYDREKGEIAVLLDWFTYRTDPAKKPWPVRYVGSWSTDHEAWFDDDGMDLDIDPTHWLPLPSVDAPQRQCAPVIAALDNDKEQSE